MAKSFTKVILGRQDQRPQLPQPAAVTKQWNVNRDIAALLDSNVSMSHKRHMLRKKVQDYLHYYRSALKGRPSATRPGTQFSRYSPVEAPPQAAAQQVPTSPQVAQVPTSSHHVVAPPSQVAPSQQPGTSHQIALPSQVAHSQEPGTSHQVDNHHDNVEILEDAMDEMNQLITHRPDLVSYDVNGDIVFRGTPVPGANFLDAYTSVVTLPTDDNLRTAMIRTTPPGYRLMQEALKEYRSTRLPTLKRLGRIKYQRREQIQARSPSPMDDQVVPNKEVVESESDTYSLY
jgi:hypothetical protein